MSHWPAMVWIWIQEISVVLLLFLFVWTITFACLMVCRWQLRYGGQRWGSRQEYDPGAEDRGWSSTGQVLGGQTIERLGDVVCGLYRAQGGKEGGLIGWTSKPRLTVWWFGAQNHRDNFLIWASKASRLRLVSCTTKLSEGGWRGTRVKI
jgi:hypothetical protein